MISEQDVLAKIKGVTTVQLRFWIAEDWVRPTRKSAANVFNDADIARLGLLHMLTNELEVGSEAIPIILSLIDQVHDLRDQMRIVAGAIEAQPDGIRVELLECARKQL